MLACWPFNPIPLHSYNITFLSCMSPMAPEMTHADSPAFHANTTTRVHRYLWMSFCHFYKSQREIPKHTSVTRKQGPLRQDSPMDKLLGHYTVDHLDKTRARSRLSRPRLTPRQDSPQDKTHQTLERGNEAEQGCLFSCRWPLFKVTNYICYFQLFTC